jgi:hypothetical protein
MPPDIPGLVVIVRKGGSLIPGWSPKPPEGPDR